jgi:hypothetical protein
MTPRQSLAKIINNTAIYYGRSLEPEVLSMMCNDLDDLPVDRVLAAYDAYRRNPKNKFFPLPAQIREIVCPEENITAEDQAREIAARICAAVPTFGWCNGHKARTYVGEIGWSVILRQGGWSYLCENLGAKIQPSTFQAQVRDQIAANLRYGDGVLEAKVLNVDFKRNNKLESVKDIVGYLPEGIGPGEGV